MPKKLIYFISLFSYLFLLTACGQKNALYPASAIDKNKPPIFIFSAYNQTTDDEETANKMTESKLEPEPEPTQQPDAP